MEGIICRNRSENEGVKATNGLFQERQRKENVQEMYAEDCQLYVFVQAAMSFTPVIGPASRPAFRLPASTKALAVDATHPKA